MSSKSNKIPFPFSPFPTFLWNYELSAEAMLLYMLMVDRAQMSMDGDKWQEEDGSIFVYFKRSEVMRRLRVRQNKATDIFHELETAGLIRREFQGRNQPAKIYITMPMEGGKTTPREGGKTTPRKVEKQSPGGLKNNPPEGGKTTPLPLDQIEGDRSKGSRSEGERYAPPPVQPEEPTPDTIRMSPEAWKVYDEWIQYTESRNMHLPSKSKTKIAEMIKANSEKYGVEAVRTLVDQMIAEGQKAIYFDRLQKADKRKERRNSDNRFHSFSEDTEDTAETDSENRFNSFS